MPLRGYRTLMVRRDFYELLEGYVNKLYPDQSLNSAILHAKKELESGELQVSLHDLQLRKNRHKGLAKYASVTVSEEVVSWLQAMMVKWRDRYRERYGPQSVKTLGTFSSWFLANLFASREESMESVVRIKREDYEWLMEQYAKRRKELELRYGVHTFEQFIPFFIRETLDRIRGARELLKQVFE